ncbi:MAG: sigma-70 region 4 domain-containing protein [Chloroflexi bacterium]|nr:sigma-70 region 4 domain-containing protein [Chloroflexota bacterium]
MDEELLQSQKEIVMMLTILAKRGIVKSALIQEMDAVGFPQKRIAELLNTTSNTVNVALNRAKKGKRK